jgi:hypothetical protein
MSRYYVGIRQQSGPTSTAKQRRSQGHNEQGLPDTYQQFCAKCAVLHSFELTVVDP